jgi:hypothetical protein
LTPYFTWFLGFFFWVAAHKFFIHCSFKKVLDDFVDSFVHEKKDAFEDGPEAAVFEFESCIVLDVAKHQLDERRGAVTICEYEIAKCLTIHREVIIMPEGTLNPFINIT